MIERLLAAERALADGDLERSERLFGQVADADPRNAIAVVGLAAIAERRGDTAAASALVERALTIDPDDAAARRMLAAPERPADIVTAAAEPEPVPAAPAPRGRWSLAAWLRGLLRRSR